MNEKLPFEKTNKCNARLRCTAENQDQQRECKYFVEAKGMRCDACVLRSFIGTRCLSPEANSEALDKLIAAVKEQL
jgi:hypothetical protein